MADFNLQADLLIRQIQLQPALSKARKQLQSLGNSLGSGNGLSNLTNQTNAYAQALAAINANLKNVTKQTQGYTQQTQAAARQQTQLANAAKETSNNVQDFADKAGLALRRFTAFSIAAGGVFGSLRAITSATKDAIEFERQLLKVTQVTKRFGESLDGIADLRSTIGNLSQQFGASSSELVSASKTFAQAGLSLKEVQNALKAVAESNLLPTFNSIAETSEGLIAIFRQFGIEGQGFREAIGQINAVSGQFAVESGDFIKAVQRAGGVFVEASRGIGDGNDQLSQFLALVTSVRATTRESAETIGTGLRTIISRLQRPDNLRFFSDLGIQLTNAEGQFVGAFEAIERIGSAIRSLPDRDPRLSQITERFGGLRQISRAIPLLTQSETRSQALLAAQQGLQSSTDDVQQAFGNLSVRLSQTNERFLTLIRDIVNTETFQGLASSALLLANTILGIGEALKEVIPLLGALSAAKIGISFVRGGGPAAFARRALSGGSSAGRTSSRRGGAPGSNTQSLIDQGLLPFNTGGKVPGSGTGDSVPALLEPGEFVINKKAAASLGPDVLRKFNNGNVKRFNTGGPVGGNLLGSSGFREVSEIFLSEAKTRGVSGSEAISQVNTVAKTFDNLEDATESLATKIRLLDDANAQSLRQQKQAETYLKNKNLTGGGTNSGNLVIPDGPDVYELENIDRKVEKNKREFAKSVAEQLAPGSTKAPSSGQILSPIQKTLPGFGNQIQPTIDEFPLRSSPLPVTDKTRFSPTISESQIAKILSNLPEGSSSKLSRPLTLEDFGRSPLTSSSSPSGGGLVPSSVFQGVPEEQKASSGVVVLGGGTNSGSLNIPRDLATRTISDKEIDEILNSKFPEGASSKVPPRSVLPGQTAARTGNQSLTQRGLNLDPIDVQGLIDKIDARDRKSASALDSTGSRISDRAKRALDNREFFRGFRGIGAAEAGAGLDLEGASVQSTSSIQTNKDYRNIPEVKKRREQQQRRNTRRRVVGRGVRFARQRGLGALGLAAGAGLAATAGSDSPLRNIGIGGLGGGFVGQQAAGAIGSAFKDPGVGQQLGKTLPVIGAVIGALKGFNDALVQLEANAKKEIFSGLEQNLKSEIDKLSNPNLSNQDRSDSFKSIRKILQDAGNVNRERSDGGIFGGIVRNGPTSRGGLNPQGAREAEEADARFGLQTDEQKRGSTFRRSVNQQQALDSLNQERNLISNTSSATERLGLTARSVARGATFGLAGDFGLEKERSRLRNRGETEEAQKGVDRASGIAQQARDEIRRLVQAGLPSQVTDDLRIAAGSDDFGAQRGGSDILKKDIGKRFEEEIVQQTKLFNKLQEVSASYETSLNDLLATTERASDIFGIFDQELAASQNVQSNIVSRASGNFAEATGTSINPFENVAALSTGDIDAALSGLRSEGLGLNRDQENLVRANAPLRELEGIINRASGGSALAGQDRVANVSQAIEDSLSGSGSLVGQFSQGIVEDIRKVTSENLGAGGSDLDARLDPSEIIGSIRSAVDAATETASNAVSRRNQLRDFTLSSANQRSGLLSQRTGLITQQANVGSARAQFRAGSTGRSLGLDESIGLAQTEVKSLAGTTDPIQILQNIRQLEQKRGDILNNPAGPGPQDTVDLANLNNSINNSKQALDKLGDSAIGLSEVQQRLSDIEDKRVSARDDFFSTFTDSPEDIQRKQRTRQASRTLESGGLDAFTQAGFGSADIADVRQLRIADARRQAAPGKQDEAADEAERRLANALAIDVDPRRTNQGLQEAKRFGAFSGPGQSEEAQKARAKGEEIITNQEEALKARQALIESAITNFDTTVTKTFNNGVTRIQEALGQFQNLRIEGKIEDINVNVKGAEVLEELDGLLGNAILKLIKDRIKSKAEDRKEKEGTP